LGGTWLRIALICPSNRLYMPYVENYSEIIREYNVNQVIINWDRFGSELEHEYTYRDLKTGHRRNVFDYWKYSEFVIRKLDDLSPDKVVVFGLQLGAFLNRPLLSRFASNYILDIRDYNRIIRLWSPLELIENSFMTVVSSPGYLEWLPPSDRYAINHNTRIPESKVLYSSTMRSPGGVVAISSVGAIRDYDINVEMLKALKDDPRFAMRFHGNSDVATRLHHFARVANIGNVLFTGRYEATEEKKLYLASDMISVLRFADAVNNKTALPNRLYNAVLYGKPLLAFQGTLLASIIEKYRLGLVIDSFPNLASKLQTYFAGFDQTEFDEGRRLFLSEVIADNTQFESSVRSFCEG